MTSEHPASFPLHIQLFGACAAHIRGERMPALKYRKELWLLALLALRHDQNSGRDELAALFWPDNKEDLALYYLRRSLANLRRALGPEAYRLLSPTPRTLRLDLSEAFCDTVAFDRAIKISSEAMLEQAVALYRGPLLPDCQEEWAHAERHYRAQTYLEALERLAQLSHERKDPAAAARWLRLLLNADPYRESAACALIQTLADSGDRAAMQQVYQELRLRLRNDLNANPSPETETLYKRLSQRAAQTLSVLPDSPPPASRRHLPVPLTDLIGREQEIEAAAGWLGRRRLVTLLGPGGVGKTRLSIAIAEAVLPQFPEGVWFVDLAALTEDSLVPAATARTLGLQEEKGGSLLERLTDALTMRSLLLVLDNCEHLPEACAALAYHLLSACPGLRILATSRQALGVTGEQAYEVPSLALPPESVMGAGTDLRFEEKDPQGALEYEAVRLFVERAMQVNPSFRLRRSNVTAVVEVCRQLDGIPLALEMAAARLRSLSIADINARLSDRFRLLTSGNRAALPRHQTLRAALDWSYDLLSAQEKALLRRLSVFAGGWTLAATELIAGDGEEKKKEEKTRAEKTSEEKPPQASSLSSAEVLDLLMSLAGKSLAIAETSGDSPRYRLLETVREYARERLEESGETLAVRARHRDYFLKVAEEIAPKLRGEESTHWLDILEEERDNLRQALTFCQEEGEDVETGLRLGTALVRFWLMHGHYREGRERMSALLSHPGVMEPTKIHADALQQAGELARLQGDFMQARSLYEESLSIHQEIGNKQGIAGALTSLGSVAKEQGDYASAHSRHEESLTLYRELGNKRGIAGVLTNLGNVAREQGDYASARSLYAECLALFREFGDKWGIAGTLLNLGAVTQAQPDYAAARSFTEESLALFRELGNKHGVADTLNNLGNVVMEQGGYMEARSLYEESLSINRELGNKQGMASALVNLGGATSLLGDYALARSLYEESLSIHRETGNKRGIAFDLFHLGNVAEEQGDYVLARSLYEESLTLFREIGHKQGIAECLGGFASLAVKEEKTALSARLWGAIMALREGIGSPLTPIAQLWQKSEFAAIEKASGRSALLAAQEEGRAMSLEQAMEYALGEWER